MSTGNLRLGWDFLSRRHRGTEARRGRLFGLACDYMVLCELGGSVREWHHYLLSRGLNRLSGDIFHHDFVDQDGTGHDFVAVFV